jgi:hypothetical protein
MKMSLNWSGYEAVMLVGIRHSMPGSGSMRNLSICVTFLQVSECVSLIAGPSTTCLSLSPLCHRVDQKNKTIWWYPGRLHTFFCYPQSTCLRGSLGEGHNRQSVNIRAPQ